MGERVEHQHHDGPRTGRTEVRAASVGAETSGTWRWAPPDKRTAAVIRAAARASLGVFQVDLRKIWNSAGEYEARSPAGMSLRHPCARVR